MEFQLGDKVEVLLDDKEKLTGTVKHIFKDGRIEVATWFGSVTLNKSYIKLKEGTK